MSEDISCLPRTLESSAAACSISGPELAVRVCPLQRLHVWRLRIMLETLYVTMKKVLIQWFPTGGPAKYVLNISAAGIYIFFLIAGLNTAANETLFGNHAPLGAMMCLMNTFSCSFCGWEQIVFVIIEQLIMLTENWSPTRHIMAFFDVFSRLFELLILSLINQSEDDLGTVDDELSRQIKHKWAVGNKKEGNLCNGAPVFCL